MISAALMTIAEQYLYIIYGLVDDKIRVWYLVQYSSIFARLREARDAIFYLQNYHKWSNRALTIITKWYIIPFSFFCRHNSWYCYGISSHNLSHGIKKSCTFRHAEVCRMANILMLSLSESFPWWLSPHIRTWRCARCCGGLADCIHYLTGFILLYI